MGYYNSFDRFVNKIRRNGFFVYTAFIVASTAYIMYSVSRLPTIPPAPKKNKKPKSLEKGEKKETELKREKDDRKETNSSLENGSSTLLESTSNKAEHDSHIVYSWSKREVYKYLFDNKIYLDVNEKLDVVREQAIQIYNHNNAPKEEPQVVVNPVNSDSFEAVVKGEKAAAEGQSFEALSEAEKEAAVAQAAFAAR